MAEALTRGYLGLVNNNKDRLVRRLLAGLSLIAGFAAIFIYSEFGIGIAFVLFAILSILAAVFALASLSQVRDYFLA